MDVQEILNKAQEAMTVKRVYGEPYEKDGLTVIPAARIQGGAGGGGGEGSDSSSGEGSGFGITARPVGAYVIKNGNAIWRPAIDVNRVIVGGQVVVVVALLMLRSALKRRR